LPQKILSRLPFITGQPLAVTDNEFRRRDELGALIWSNNIRWPEDAARPPMVEDGNPVVTGWMSGCELK